MSIFKCASEISNYFKTVLLMTNDRTKSLCALFCKQICNNIRNNTKVFGLIEKTHREYSQCDFKLNCKFEMNRKI